MNAKESANARRPKIVVAEAYSDEAVARLRQCGDVVLLDAHDPATLLAAVADADALLVRSYAEVTEDVIAAAPRLRVIGRGGVGIENIDVAAAGRRGVVVVYTPEASTRCVAEHALGLMLAAERRIVGGDEAVRDGRFMAYRGTVAYRELGACTLGVVGMGRIGTAVARIAAVGFGMRVLYNDIVPVGPFDFPATPVDKPRLYHDCDFITLHVPLTDQTRRLIGRQTLAQMKPSTVVVNTARGAVVDADALADALQSNRLAASALDVVDPEPLPADHKLLTLPNVVLTPHLAGRSVEALRRMNAVVEDIVAVVEGRSPRFAAGGQADRRTGESPA